ncbi:MAG: selenocysteine-specific elongation factor [Oceanicoccus sp.]|jgi:selenocysteine-specific elongation factor
MIVATAGHVDHGKTSLVKHLTGVDTDRLEEEKRRGLSINLGFAYRSLPNGNVLGFIDVPGHTRFINTMIAGVTGIDLGMLVVAADDGPMPQTKEHLDVLRLLGVKNYLLVITKTDRVEEERVNEVIELARGFLGVDVPTFRVSNVSGSGISELQSHIDKMAQERSVTANAGHFRMSVDRAFSIKGSGLVVTGTAIAGEVRIGDTLLLQPHAVKVRVRGIHAQDQRVEVGHTGQRCALNIVGDIDRNSIGRGSVLVAEALDRLSLHCDVRLNLLASAPFSLKHLSPVKIHLGAGRYSAKIFFLEKIRKLEPGVGALAQILFDEPVSVCHGDRFLLRDDSESVSLGGGVILDPCAPIVGKSRPERLSLLSAMEADDAAKVLESLVVDQGKVVNFNDFKRDWNIRADEQAPLLADTMRLQDSHLISSAVWQRYKEELNGTLSTWHKSFPTRDGMPPRELRGEIEEVFFVPLLTEHINDGTMLLRGGLVALAKHRIAVSSEDLEHWNVIEKAYNTTENHLPLVSDLLTLTNMQRPVLMAALKTAVKSKRMVKINDNRYGRPTELALMANKALGLGKAGAAFSVAQYKTEIGSGRKLAIELLEFFDGIRFTQRRENERVILDSLAAEKLFSD